MVQLDDFHKLYLQMLQMKERSKSRCGEYVVQMNERCTSRCGEDVAANRGDELRCVSHDMSRAMQEQSGSGASHHTRDVEVTTARFTNW